MATARSNGRLPKFQRVMIVSAHPDDPDFGAGGAIARLADSGAEVTVRLTRPAAVLCTSTSFA